MTSKNYIFLISSLFLLLLSQTAFAQNTGSAQNCETPYNARNRGDFCIYAENMNMNVGFQTSTTYTFKINGVTLPSYAYEIKWYLLPYGATFDDSAVLTYYNSGHSVGGISLNPGARGTICARIVTRDGFAFRLIKEGYLDTDLTQINATTSGSCGENNCEIVGLINGGFEDKYWTNSKWIRKNKHADGQIIEYSNFTDNYTSLCEQRIDDLYGDLLLETLNNTELQAFFAQLRTEDFETCNQEYIPFFGDCSQNAENQKIDAIARLNALGINFSQTDTDFLDDWFQSRFNITMLNCFQGDDTFADNTLLEHFMVDRSFSFQPLNDDLVLPSEYLNNPNTINNRSLLLGKEGGLLAYSLGTLETLGEMYNYNIEASIEQTFFVEETEAARLDIWYAWVANYYKEELIENDDERRDLFEAPVFSIELFRTDADGNDYLVESFIESQQDNFGTFLSIENGLNIHDVFKDWGYNDGSERKPFTLDLSPYKGELVKLKITSYDRFIKDEETGNVHPPKRLDSYAIIDIACASCCVPAQDFAEENPYSISEGIVTITRPQLPCELLPEVEDRCDPTFFYQITSDKGEPYVLEGKGTSIEFVPQYVGQYAIYYKHSESCCWNETPLPVRVTDVVEDINLPRFSNELKLSGVHCIPSFYMDSVLAVGASSFMDRQFINTQEIAQSDDKAVIENYLLTQNPYLTGERGIWRTEGSYAYVTERRGTKTVKEDDIEEIEDNGNLARTGGTFELNMFNWQNRGVVPENWRKTGETSRYNPYNYGVESRDVLGRYSSALYGYNGQLSTAVCANAAYTEIAYDGFEDESQTSNFKITNPTPNTIDRSMTLKVLWAKGNKGVLEGYTPPSNNTTGIPVRMPASLIAYVLGKQDIIEIKPTILADQTIQDKIMIQLTYRDETTSWFEIVPNIGVTTDAIDPRLFTEQWYGSLSIGRYLFVMDHLSTSGVGAVEVTDSDAHTGRKSLIVTGSKEILQSNLLLKPTQKYVISAWVKVQNAEEQTYSYADNENIGIQLSFYKINGTPASIPSSSVIVPVGNIIEGWQRLEGVVEIPEATFYVTTTLKGNDKTVHYDDIRIFPADGSMKTFVYDPINYLLRAVLDENNYASLYFYDNAERLFLTQKETREGIYTIQENGGFIKYKEPIDD